MLGVIYKLWPASGFPLAGLVLVVPGNLVMPSVSSARGGSARGGSSAQCGQCPWRQRPGGRRQALLSLELQVSGKAHRVDAVLLHRFLVAGGKFGVVFIAGARSVVNVI